METTEPIFKLGRQYIPDERDNKYLINDHVLRKIKKTKITSRYWDDNIWWGDQGNTPQCVGYAWSHWLNDGPVYHSGPKPKLPPNLIYENAQKLDVWPGENYDGTSVRGGAKFLQNQKLISRYYWGYSLKTLVDTVLNIGPVVVGTNWYYGMFFPTQNSVIRATGPLAGGHAYVINGVATSTQMFRLKNSWGRNWGQGGHAYISFSDMDRLIREQGEICLATERRT